MSADVENVNEFSISLKRDFDSSPILAMENEGSSGLKSERRNETLVSTPLPEEIFKSGVTTPINNEMTPSTVCSTPDPASTTADYVENIENAFGINADLYEDVLKVSKECSSRDLRVAYFRRGREVLSQKDCPSLSLSSATVSHDLPKQVKNQFQAISMAYEILSTPALKNAYDARLFPEEDFFSESITRSVPASPSFCDTASVGGRSVRWSEEVEELVYDKDPMEKNNARKIPPKKRSGKHKKRVILGSGDIGRHLEELDKEAKQYFVPDFMDGLESSIEGLLSKGSSKSKDTDLPMPKDNADFGKAPYSQTDHFSEKTSDDENSICSNIPTENEKNEWIDLCNLPEDWCGTEEKNSCQVPKQVQICVEEDEKLGNSGTSHLLLTYLKAMTDGLNHIGSFIKVRAYALLDTIVVSEDDLDKMIVIIREEDPILIRSENHSRK